jgi:hypothetical protein
MKISLDSLPLQGVYYVAKGEAMKTTQLKADARTRIQKAIALLEQAIELLGDGDDLERTLAGQTQGMVDTAGDAKQGTFRTWEARESLKRALSTTR